MLFVKIKGVTRKTRSFKESFYDKYTQSYRFYERRTPRKNNVALKINNKTKLLFTVSPILSIENRRFKTIIESPAKQYFRFYHVKRLVTHYNAFPSIELTRENLAQFSLQLV